MQKESLQDVMNALVRKPSIIVHWLARDPETEIEAFIRIDRTLFDLHKDYKNALKIFEKLKRKHGTDDPMVDIAVDMVDSTLCAFETRLIELKRKRKKAALAKKMMQKIQLDIERERRKETALWKARLFSFYSLTTKPEAMRRKQDRKSEDFFFFVMWMWYFALEQGRYTFSLKNDFHLVNKKQAGEKAG